MKNFAFHRPQSLADAAVLLQSGDAKLLAGGQSLIPVLKLDLAQPSDVVSLAGLTALKAIRGEGGNLVIGALATHDEVAGSAEVKSRIPALAALASGIGDAQVRNRGTIGGSIAHADPSADYPAALVALGATVETNVRKIAAEEFFTGFFQTALAPDEIVTAVHFPVPERAAYAKFPHPASKYAVVGVMVAKTAGGVRVAVTGAGTQVFRLKNAEAALAADFRPEAVQEGAVSTHDLRADGDTSQEYRAHLVTVMARRAVQACQ